MIGLTVSTTLFLLLVLLLRKVASQENPTLAVIAPAQMHAYVTTKNEPLTTTAKGGGGGQIVDVIHAIPGRRLNKSHRDPMEWHYEKKKQIRGIFYHLFGIQFIWLFRYLRLNSVRTFRYGRKSGEKEYHMMSEDSVTRFVHFSGQHDMLIEHAETKEMLKVDLRLNILFEETYPVKVRLRTADPYAVMTMMVRRVLIRILGGVDPKKLISDEKLQKKLAEDVMKFSGKIVEDHLGITITRVTLDDVHFDTDTTELLERESRARLEAEANLITAKNDAEQEIARAEGRKKAQILDNDADEDGIKRVVKRAAADNKIADLYAKIRMAEAIEKNTTITTWAPGGAQPVIPLKP